MVQHLVPCHSFNICGKKDLLLKVCPFRHIRVTRVCLLNLNVISIVANYNDIK